MILVLVIWRKQSRSEF